MFGTLRYANKGGTSGLVSHLQPCDSVHSQEKHLACDLCRSRKLKCSGQRSGCNRCKASNSTCSYFTPAKGVVSRSRKRSSAAQGSRSGAGRTNNKQSADGPTPERSIKNNASASSPKALTVQTSTPSIAPPLIIKEEKSPFLASAASTGSKPTSDTMYQNHAANIIADRPNASNNIHLQLPDNPISTSDLPDWLTNVSGDDAMDFSYSKTGFFTPIENLQTFDEDCQMNQLKLMASLETDLTTYASAQDFKDPFGATVGPGLFCDTQEERQLSLNCPVDIFADDYTMSKQSPDQKIDLMQITNKHNTPPRQLPSPRTSTASDAGNQNDFSPANKLNINEQNYMTSTSMTAPRSGSVASSSHATGVGAQVCQCLQAMAAMLESIEVKTFSEGATSIDAMMNFHQEALEQCNAMISCNRCVTRSEKMMLVVMALEKLVSLVEKACQRYVQDYCNAIENTNSLPHSILSMANENSKDIDYFNNQRPRKDSVEPIHSINGSSALTFSPFCGQYKVSTVQDWSSIISVLLHLRMKAMDQAINRMKSIPLVAQRDSHIAILNGCDNRLQQLRQTVRVL